MVFGGFSVESVRERIEESNAKALITADGARRKGTTAPIKSEGDQAMADLPGLETVIVVRHAGLDNVRMSEGRDRWYHEALEAADDECPAEALDAEHPLFILYSSGSTAKPKGIVHTTGGYLTGVDLDLDLALERLARGRDHRPPELMQHHPCLRSMPFAETGPVKLYSESRGRGPAVLQGSSRP